MHVSWFVPVWKVRASHGSHVRSVDAVAAACTNVPATHVFSPWHLRHVVEASGTRVSCGPQGRAVVLAVAALALVVFVAAVVVVMQVVRVVAPACLYVCACVCARRWWRGGCTHDHTGRGQRDIMTAAGNDPNRPDGVLGAAWMVCLTRGCCPSPPGT